MIQHSRTEHASLRAVIAREDRIEKEARREAQAAHREQQRAAPGAKWSTKVRKKPERVDPVLSKHRAKVREDWSKRHPGLARDERAIRVSNAKLRDRWKHKNEGTVETHEQASRVSQGALARLHQTGAIDGDQLAYAVEIRTACELVMRGVAVQTASLETRVDRKGRRDGVFHEALGSVWNEMTYSRWRAQIAVPLAMLDMIVGDEGVTIVAKRHRLGVKRAKKLLIDALDLWPRLHAEVRREVDRATLMAAHAGIL